MGYYISQRFIIKAHGDTEVAVYINTANQVYFGDDDDAYGTSFVLERSEWEDLKTFIDGLYKDLKD